MVSPIRPDFAPQLSARTAEPPRRVDQHFARVMQGRAAAAASAPAAAAAPGRVVEARRTHLSGEQAGAALSQAYAQLTGETPNAQTTSILTAQWAHETGRGASMYNYNFGGIKGTGPSGLSVAQRTKEGYGATEHEIVDRFRAYQSAEEGALDYVRLLKARYPAALDAAKQGDAAGFVHALKARGYFTGDPAAYVRSVSTMSEQALTRGLSALGAGGAIVPSVGREPMLGEAEALAQFDTAELLERAPSTPTTPFIDALRIADEISRAALRITTTFEDSSRRENT